MILLTRHLNRTSKGSSEAHIFSDVDGNEYVVKFKETPQGIKVLSNEYVSGEIAQMLNLPSPNCYIVEIDAQLIDTLPLINGHKVTEKHHFATALVKNVYTRRFPAIRSFIGNCENKDQYPDIILFDVLIYNADRDNDGNFLILSKNGKYYFNIIDHGHAFNCNWDEKTILTLINQWTDSKIDELYNEISEVLNCDDAITKIEALPDDFFIKLVDQLPDDWDVNNAEKGSLKKYLIDQRNSIANLVTTNKHLFANLK